MSSTATGKSASPDVKELSTRLSRKKQNGWAARHTKLAQKIGFVIQKNGEIRSSDRHRFPTHPEAVEYVKTSKHWLCERARVEVVRRMMLWNSTQKN